jgi:2-octaprenyl-6-methoxyphenol hydroxylase
MTLRIAVIGAGPAGLALALHAARTLPRASVTLFDARPAERDPSGDPRTLALALGSVQWLQQLGCWPAAAAAPITRCRCRRRRRPSAHAAVWIRARRTGGADARRRARLRRAGGAAAGGLAGRRGGRAGAAEQPFRHPGGGRQALPAGVEVDAGIVEAFDLAVVAEGGVFAEQARKAIARDYGQTAWVGTATLAGRQPGWPSSASRARARRPCCRCRRRPTARAARPWSGA